MWLRHTVQYRRRAACMRGAGATLMYLPCMHVPVGAAPEVWERERERERREREREPGGGVRSSTVGWLTAHVHQRPRRRGGGGRRRAIQGGERSTQQCYTTRGRMHTENARACFTVWELCAPRKI